MIDLGCGDGSQLELLRVGQYQGFDIAPKAVELCTQKYQTDVSKSFALYDPSKPHWSRSASAELAVSLDVIYHLLENKTYNMYLKTIFNFAQKYVVIYANNTDEQNEGSAKHLRFHKFTNWVKSNRPDWVLAGYVPNRYPFRTDDADNTSFADFYIFSKKEKLDPDFSVFFPDPAIDPAKFPEINTGKITDLMRQAGTKFQDPSIPNEEALEFHKLLCRRILQEEPLSLPNLNDLSLVLSNFGFLKESEELYRTILAEDPKLHFSRMNYTFLLFRQQKFNQLNSFYNELFTLISKSPESQKLFPFLLTKVDNLNYFIKKK
jgi:hypothetical protein